MKVETVLDNLQNNKLLDEKKYIFMLLSIKL